MSTVYFGFDISNSMFSINALIRKREITLEEVRDMFSSGIFFLPSKKEDRDFMDGKFQLIVHECHPNYKAHIYRGNSIIVPKMPDVRDLSSIVFFSLWDVLE